MKTALMLTALAALAFITLAWAVVPNLLLFPDRDQTAGDLTFAYWLNRLGPVATVVLAVVFGALAVMVWRRPRRPGFLSGLLRFGLLVVLALPVVGGVLLSRTTVAEQAFAALSEVRLSDPSESGLADDEMVMGIEVGGQARAYPVKIVGYHHIVHDTVAGEPIVVTY